MPSTQEPPANLVEAAARDVPVILADQRPDSDGTVRLPAQLLIEELRQRGHVLVAAEWAVYRLLEGGQFTAEPFDLYSAIFGRQVGRQAMFGAPDTRSMEWVGGATIGTAWTISFVKDQPEKACGASDPGSMPDEHTARLARARQKEMQINELVQRRQGAEVVLYKARALPALGIGTDPAEIKTYALRLIEIVEILIGLGFTEKLDKTRAENDDAKAEAIAVYKLARSHNNFLEIIRLLEELCEPSHVSFSLAVEQWLRVGLVQEILADLLDEPEHPRLHIEQQHNAALACLEALERISGQTIKPSDSVPEALAELQRAVQAIPETEQDAFGGTSVVQLGGTYGTSWHQVVLRVAQDWAMRLPKNMADTQRLGQVLVCPGLGKDPNEARAALDAEMSRAAGLHVRTQDRSSEGEGPGGMAGRAACGTEKVGTAHTEGTGEERLKSKQTPRGQGRPRRTVERKARQIDISNKWYRFYDSKCWQGKEETPKAQFCRDEGITLEELEAALRQNRRKKSTG
jgi:hypothetical protein